MSTLIFNDNCAFLVIATNREILLLQGAKEGAILQLGSMREEEASLGRKLVTFDRATACEEVKLGSDKSQLTNWSDILFLLNNDDPSIVLGTSLSFSQSKAFLVVDSTIGELPPLSGERTPIDYVMDLSAFPAGVILTQRTFQQIWAPEPEPFVRRFVRALVDRALLQRAGDDRFAVHPIIRMYLRARNGSLGSHFENVTVKLDPASPSVLVAADWNDRQALRTLLQSGHDPNAKSTRDSATALHMAAERGFFDIVSDLIKAGAAVGERFTGGFTALFQAATNGHVNVMRILLEAGAEVDGRTEDGSSPLHIAAQRGQRDAVALLLERGASPILQNKHHQTPLYEASSHGHTPVIELLLARVPLAAQETSPSRTPMYLASANGHVGAVQALLAASSRAIAFAAASMVCSLCPRASAR